MRKAYTAVIALLLLAACSKGKAVATVDGERISSTALIERMRMEKLLYDPAVLDDDVNFVNFRRQALDGLIREEILLKEAKRLGLDEIEPASGAGAKPGATGMPDGEALSERGIDAGWWKESQRRRAIIRRLIDREVLQKIPVDENEVKEYYRKHIGDYRDNTRFHARQILVDKKEDADRIYVKLMNGADFAELAKEHSVSPDSERGGDLGYFDAEAYPEVFSEICQQLKPGEISHVTATPYGFQIFQLIAKRPPRQRTLEEVRGEIERILREDDMEKAFAPWLESLMKRARVSINEATLKEVRLNG